MNPRAAMRLALSSLLAGLLAACGGVANLPQPAPLPELDTPLIEADVLWDTDTGAGGAGAVSGFALAVRGERAYTAGREGVVTALAIENGEILWQVESGARLISGPTVAGDTLLFGTRDGKVLALSIEDGSELWQTTLSGEVLAAPAAGQGIVVAHTLDGRLTALSLADGERIWSLERGVPTLTLRGTSSPIIVDGVVYAGLDNGSVIALDLANGETLWEQTVAAPTGRSELERVVDVDAPLLAVDGSLFAASVGERMVAISMASGRIRWNREIGSRTGFTFDTDQVFTTDLASHVWSIGRATGAAIWENEQLAHRQLSRPAMFRAYVMVGDYEGYLHWMIPEDGSLIGRADVLDARIAYQPIVVGERILVLGADGTVAAVEASFVQRED